MVRDTFPEFCTSSDGIPIAGNLDINNSREQYSMIGDESSALNHNNSSINQNLAKFSDEEEEPAAKKPKRSKKEVKESKVTKETNDTKNGKKSTKVVKENNNIISSSSALSKSDLITQIEQINNEEMRSCLTRLHEDKFVI